MYRRPLGPERLGERAPGPDDLAFQLRIQGDLGTGERLAHGAAGLGLGRSGEKGGARGGQARAPGFALNGSLDQYPDLADLISSPAGDTTYQMPPTPCPLMSPGALSWAKV